MGFRLYREGKLDECDAQLLIWLRIEVNGSTDVIIYVTCLFHIHIYDFTLLGITEDYNRQTDKRFEIPLNP